MPVPFEGLLGSGCELKLIEFLMPLKDMEFNLTELAEEVSVSRPTVDRIVKKFVKWGLMKVAHTHGKTKYYALNEDSGFVRVFEVLNNRLVEQILGQEKLAQVGEYWTKHASVSCDRVRGSDNEASLGESLFIRELGIKSPMLKVLDFLMDNEAFDYSKTEIAEGTDLSRATLFKVWSKLEALDLITATREVGRAKMYKLNKGNPIVKKLMELDDTISEYFAQKHCNPQNCASDGDISGIVGPGQGLVKAIVDYENAKPDSKKSRSKELLIA